MGQPSENEDAAATCGGNDGAQPAGVSPAVSGPEYPSFGGVMPKHWSRLPLTAFDETQARSTNLVLLPGGFGSGTQVLADWVSSWLLLDIHLEKDSLEGPWPFFEGLDSDLVADAFTFHSASSTANLNICVVTDPACTQDHDCICIPSDPETKLVCGPIHRRQRP